jgi:uncharacterized protein YbaP (TraB family)
LKGTFNQVIHSLDALQKQIHLLIDLASDTHLKLPSN